MNNLKKCNNNEFIPTSSVAVSATQEPTQTASTTIKLYRVPINASCEMSLTGEIEVYATSEFDASNKVRSQIDSGRVDQRIQMQDEFSNITMSYRELSDVCADVGIDEGGIEVIEAEVDPDDVLAEDIKELEGQISWDTDSLEMQKKFLWSVLTTEALAAVL